MPKKVHQQVKVLQNLHDFLETFGEKKRPNKRKQGVLVGGFKPFQKYAPSQIGSLPHIEGEKKQNIWNLRF